MSADCLGCSMPSIHCRLNARLNGCQQCSHAGLQRWTNIHQLCSFIKSHHLTKTSFNNIRRKCRALPKPRGHMRQRWSLLLSVALSQKPVYGAKPQTWGLLNHTVCLFTPRLLLVPSYTVWWHRHIGVINLPKVVILQHNGGAWTHDHWVTSLMP